MSSMDFKALSASFGFAELTSKQVGLLFVAAVVAIVPLDLSQLAFAVIGALAYALLQAFSPRPAKTNCQLAAEHDQAERDRNIRRPPPWRTAASKGNQGNYAPRQFAGSKGSPSKAAIHSKAPPVFKPEVLQPSSMPVLAPTFTSSGWEAEVSELLEQLTPGPSEDQAVQRLAQHIKQTIKALFPDVEVTGFAHASVACGKAFGVAVPEVDIVANITPGALMQRLAQRQKYDVKKLQKSAVRVCTDRLVGYGGLKFRRSAFRGDEPRVTLLVPSSLGFFNDAVPVDFSINTLTPFYTAALLTECGQMEPRAKALMLLVKRWAKDRGICHAAKGHLSPYLWSLLTMYFMQVGVDEEGSLLPALENFKFAKNLMMSTTASSLKQKGASPTPVAEKADTANAEKLSIGQLFGKFLHFYSQNFNWTNEAISIRLGRRAAPGLSVPLHVVLEEDGTSRIAPAIEDPFQAGNNLGACMNTVSLGRLHEELTRGNELYQRGTSLTELLTPWKPPEEAQEKGTDSSPGEQDDEQSHAASKKTSK